MVSPIATPKEVQDQILIAISESYGSTLGRWSVSSDSFVSMVFNVTDHHTRGRTLRNFAPLVKKGYLTRSQRRDYTVTNKGKKYVATLVPPVASTEEPLYKWAIKALFLESIDGQEIGPEWEPFAGSINSLGYNTIYFRQLIEV